MRDPEEMNLIFYPFHTWHIMFGSVPLLVGLLFVIVTILFI
ncbi:putative membrane protein [Bacteroides fragilis str. S24L34]|nr:putative membrane protein [Bacteroides fragilis str. S24L34]